MAFSDFTQEHRLTDVIRYHDNTRHMIEFEVRSIQSPIGAIGGKLRLFLTDAEYTEALEHQNSKHIKIRRHAYVIEGNIVYDRKKNKRRR